MFLKDELNQMAKESSQLFWAPHEIAGDNSQQTQILTALKKYKHKTVQIFYHY